MYVRQIILKAEFWNIRITVSFVVVPGFEVEFVVLLFLHVFVYFSPLYIWNSWNKKVWLVLDNVFDAFM